jgi:hypothetical protein
MTPRIGDIMANASEETLSRVYSIASTVTSVTPSDTADLSRLSTKGIWVGTGASNLSVRTVGSTTTVVIANVPDGCFLPLQVSRIMTGTNASDIVAFS